MNLLWGALFGAQPLAQGQTFDELHRDDGGITQKQEIVDLHDIGTGQSGHSASFSTRPARCTLGDHLERQLAVELGVVGFVDYTHASAAELPQDLVATNGTLRCDLDQLLLAGGAGDAFCRLRQGGHHHAAFATALKMPLQLLAGALIEGSTQIAGELFFARAGHVAS